MYLLKIVNSPPTTPDVASTLLHPHTASTRPLPGQALPYTRNTARDASATVPLTQQSPSPQPLPKHLKELGSSSLIEPKYARAINMRIQHNLTIDLCHPEIAESSTAVNLAGGGNSAVLELMTTSFSDPNPRVVVRHGLWNGDRCPCDLG